MTGPKISRCTASSVCGRPETTVGRRSSRDRRPRAAGVDVAWSGSRSTKPATVRSWLALLSGPKSTSVVGGRGRVFGRSVRSARTNSSWTHRREHPGGGGAVLPALK
jgi:hypothetical protein